MTNIRWRVVGLEHQLQKAEPEVKCPQCGGPGKVVVFWSWSGIPMIIDCLSPNTACGTHPDGRGPVWQWGSEEEEREVLQRVEEYDRRRESEDVLMQASMEEGENDGA